MSQRLHIDAETLARLQADERAHRRRQKRLAIVLALAVLLGLGGILYALDQVAKTQPPKVVIDPANLPPIQPGPPRS